MVTGISEWARELLRKPYITYGYMYSNGIRKNQIPDLNQGGFLATSKWASLAPAGHTVAQGEMMFRYQCMSCHTTTGYRSMQRLLGERDIDGIRGFLQILRETDPKKNPYSGIMPPLAGKDHEVEALAQYLNTIERGQAKKTASNPKPVAQPSAS
jgi:mono/diheme cytochrome c family protein